MTETIARWDWLGPAEEAIQKAVRRVFEALPAGRQVEDALHGTWVGHPLHVILTDIPLGTWSAALIFDVLDLRGAADASIAMGLVGAAGAALTGATDWHVTDPPARRIGLVHGLLNSVGAGLFAASWLMRRRRRRNAGRWLALAGMAAAVTSARLGGHLVYRDRIGVDRAAEQPGPEEFAPVLGENDLAEDEMRKVDYHGTPILLVRQSGQVFALAETCSHLGGPLAEGTLGDGSVTCPWHGSCFALDDGRVLDGPAVHPQPCFEVRLRGGRIEVRTEQPAGIV
jgi:nitrite reductase/ring-hydroxylating ferredoxin subunit/uncharacterized membrane protein